MNEKTNYKIKIESSASEPPKLKTISMKEIQQKQFPPREYLVPALIPARGLTLLVGKPKMHKSYFILDLTCAATMDGTFLGVTPKQGPVLYVSLEDDDQRIQERSRQMFPAYVGNWEWADQLRFSYECPRMDEGGLEAIADYHHELKQQWGKPSFIAIDVFQKIRPHTARGTDRYEADYDAVSSIKKLTMELDTSIILVHHARKMDGTDSLDVVSGSQGIAGAADNIFIIRKDKSGETIFDITGRDVEAVALLAKFNKECCRWELSGEYEPMSKDQREIHNWLEEDGEKTLNEIANKFGNGNYDAFRKKINRMVEKGTLIRPQRGLFAISNKKTI